MKSKLFKVTLLFTFLTCAVVQAQHEEDNNFWYDTRIAVEFGFGVPYGYSLKEKLKEKYKIGNQTVDPHFSPNIHAGILASHDFNLTDTFSMGPEIGFCYGFTRRSEIKNLSISIAEKYITLPLYLRMTKYYDPDDFLVSISFVLGYDFDIFLSSTYTQTGNYAVDPSFLGNKDLYESIKDLPRVSGSIVLGDAFEFPKGFYIAAKARLPIAIFQLFKEEDNRGKELNATYVKFTRGLTTNLAELSLGLDIMRLIQG